MSYQTVRKIHFILIDLQLKEFMANLDILQMFLTSYETPHVSGNINYSSFDLK